MDPFTALPMAIQPGARFDCHRCGACCRREVGVPLEAGELERIEEHPWAQEGPRFRRGWVERPGAAGEPARLRTEGGACVFLDTDDGLCLIHKRLGVEAKPVRCRAFPLRFASAPDGVHVAVSPECASLHRSFEDGTSIEDGPELQALALAAPRLLILGRAFVLRSGEPPALGWDDVRAALEDVVGATEGGEALEDLPWAVARPVKRLLDGPVPPTPWRYEGPRSMPFYQCLDVLGETLAPVANGLGLGLLSSSFAAMRRWLVWRDSARALDPGAADFLKLQLRALAHELRPLQLGQVTGGVGSALYLVMASAVGAARLGEVEGRGRRGSAADANRVAREAAIFYREPDALAAMEAQLLAFERLLFDAPAPETDPGLQVPRPR